jgi:hypothetical protein
VQATHDVTIDRPIENVFDFLADGTNNRYWQPMVVSTESDGTPIGVGTVFRQKVRHPLGFKVSADYRLTAYERPTTLAVVVISGGPIRPTMSYELAAHDRITTVRCTLESGRHGLGRLAAPFLAVIHPLFAWEAAWVDDAKEILELPEEAR